MECLKNQNFHIPTMKFENRNVIEDEKLKDFCNMLPKVELHAHLNGSLSLETLKKLHLNLGLPDEQFETWNHEATDHDKCFELFAIAHKVTVTPENVYEATCDVIDEFAQDNVVYLELRSTPRAVEGHMTKQEYIDAIIKAAEKKNLEKKIMVKILISINRKEGSEAGEKNVLLAIDAHKKHPNIVVGIDLSGQPKDGKFNEDFKTICEEAKSNNLKLALHCGEVPHYVSEAHDIIHFNPDRLGHCIHIHPETCGSQEVWDKLIQLKIPVEICLTSNLKTNSVKDLKDHHLKYLLQQKHPFVLSTDDKGVFNTTLSNEYYIAARTFNFSKDDIWTHLIDSINYIFGNERDKIELRQIINTKKNEC